MEGSDVLGGGNVEIREISTEMRSAYLDYAMSVIVGRALPDVRDGLKPVHRRVLYAMHDLGLQPNRPYRKSAFIVGEVMGKYHPHGDQSIYDTLVRMAQDFSLRIPLVDGQGNFGSIDDDPAAAMRYTEARLARLATEMLRDIEAETVDFGPNYDESSAEPLVLPARFPNLLVNGSSGIAVGMATNIPPHNLGEVIGAVQAYIEDPEIDVEGLMGHVKGPDFPGGGTIMGSEGIRQAYRSGRGSVRVRAKAHIEPIKSGKEAIIVSELPFMVKKGGDGGLITKIADLVRDKKITEVSDLRDESDRSGMRLVIELKRDAIPKVALNKLFKHTQMQSTFGVNMVALVEGVPRTLSLKEMVHHYVGHQREVVIRRTQYQLRQAEARAHVLEGILDRARQPRRRDRADPRLGVARRGALGPDREVRAERDPGAGDPRHAPAAADRARVRQGPRRARGADRQDRRAARDPRRREADRRRHQQGAGRARRALRRRAPHRDHLRRGRGRHRGHDRRPADGDLADRVRLREAAAARDLPPAASRRQGRDRDEPQGRRLHRAPSHLLDPRLPAVLHQPRQGLPAQGLRAA